MLETRLTPAVTYGSIVGQGPPRDTVPPKVTIDFLTNPSNKNQTITGRVTDNYPIAGDTLLMRMDNGAPQALRLGPAGQFQFTSTFKTDGTADGNHTFTFVARDAAGNYSAFARTSFVLNTTNGQLTIKLDPSSDDGTAGDNKTTQATVKLTGTGPKNATITLTLPGGTTTTTTSDANGAYAFTNVALVSGPNAFKVTATGTNSQHLSANLTIIRDNAPTVAQAISNFAVSTNSGPSKFNLPTVFSDQDVNALVEFTTNRGTFDVELFNQQVGTTVANFLKYVTGTIASHQSYNNTIFHRVTNVSTDGIGVLQGGGYILGTDAGGKTTLTHITGDAAIALQDLLTNARGTIAMARTSAPNSATSEFFINTVDNASLDHGGQGANSNGYAVFGVVRGNGMSVVDASAAVPPVNEGGAFASLPITGATPNDPNFPGDTTASQYERITGVTVLRQPNAAAPDSLTYTAASSNTSLVTTSIVNGELVLTYASGQTGSSLITLTATDSAGVAVTSTFTVAVGDHSPPSVSITSPTSDVSVNANPTITGTATDDTGVTKLVASVDGGAAQTVAVDSQGHFSFTPNLPTNGSGDGAHTVVFTATDAAGNNSTPASVTFHLDTTAPVVTISSPTDNQTFGNNPTITGTATDNQTLTGLTASVDGGAAQNVTVDSTGNWTFTTSFATDGTADGTHHVVFSATDKAGNTSNQATLTFILNTAHPSVTITSPAPDQSFKTNPAFTGSVTDASEAGHLTASVDGGTPVDVTVDAQGNFSFTPTVTADGPHTVTFSAPGHADVSRTYTLDATAPVVTITSPASGQTFNFNPTLKGTVVDATSGIATVTVSVDGGQTRVLDLDAQGNFSYIPPVASGGAADGPHTVTIVATDKVGNTTTQDFTYTLDTVAPVVQITAPAAGTSQKTSPDFTGTVTDAGGVASLTVSVDGGTDQTITFDAQGNFTFNPNLATDGSADGAHTYTFTSTDNAGNISHLTETVYLDTTKPVATVTSPASGQTFTDNVTINGSATDNIGSGFVNVYVDGVFVTGFAFPTNGSFSYTTTLPTDGTANGPHTVSFVTTDAAGNLSDPADFTFTLASPTPAVHLTAPSEGQASNTVPTFTGSVSDISEANSLTASVDGGAAQPVTVDGQGNFAFVPSVSGDGTHSVTFSANGAFTAVTRSFVLDTVAPTVNVTSPSNGQTFTTNPTITGTSSDATSGVASAHVSVDDGPPIDVAVDAQGNFTFTTGLATDGSADGNHTVSVTVTDKAGNVSTAVVVNFTLDTVAPVVNLNGPGDGTSQNTSPQFSGQATDANGLSSLTVSVDGGAALTLAHDSQGNFSFNPNLPTDGSADGAHTYVFTATDAAGHATTVSRTVYLDTTKPVAMINSPADNQTFNTNPTITGSATDNIGSGFVNVYVDGVFVTGFAFPTNGSFSYTTSFKTDGSDNGQHTVTFVVTDAAGNMSDPVTLHFTLQAP